MRKVADEKMKDGFGCRMVERPIENEACRRKGDLMKRKHAIGILALPALAVLALLYIALAQGLHTDSLKEFENSVGFFIVCFIMFGIPLYVWIPLGVASFSVGAWLLLTSQLRNRARIVVVMSVLLAMFPVLILASEFLFMDYRGP